MVFVISMFRYKLLKVFGIGITVLTLAAIWTGRDVIIRPPIPAYEISRQDISVNIRHLLHNWTYSSSAENNPRVSQKLVNATSTSIPPPNDLRSSHCVLSWNTEQLNTTLYEADSLVFKRPGKVEENYIPSLVYANPDIILHRHAYLLPDLIWGPNNQLVGFIESVFVAIKLNRTLVLPSFLKHNTDRQFKRGSRNRISPLHRVDVGTLCKFISCITIEQFHRYCHHEIDGIINIRLLKEKDFRTIESDTKMWIPREDESHFSIEDILIPSNGTSEKRPKLSFTEREIPTLFQSKAKCVVYPFPFFHVMGEDKNGNRQVLYSMISKGAFQNADTRTDVRLLVDIFKHIKRPAYVRQIASDFIQFTTNGRGFLSSHWRYNEGDYLSSWHCGNKEVNQRRCDKARNYTSLNFAERIASKVEKLADRKFKINTVYIASPRTEQKFITDTSKHLGDMHESLKVFHSIDLEKFIRERYPHCDFLSFHFEDILSSIEMEVCSRAVSFLGSLGTTWSGNVFKSRMQLDEKQHEISPDYIFRV